MLKSRPFSAFHPFHARANHPAFLALFCAAVSLPFSGCNDVSNPHDHNETEVFTTVKLRLANQADTSDMPEATIRFKDGFGHGDALEKNETLKLQAGATYSAELVLLNESVSPPAVMSEEVAEEGEDHQVFYSPAGASLTVTYADKDAKDNPIGLSTEFRAGNAGTGTLKVVLKHQPGEKTSVSTVEIGETDIEVNFNVLIE